MSEIPSINFQAINSKKKIKHLGSMRPEAEAEVIFQNKNCDNFGVTRTRTYSEPPEGPARAQNRPNLAFSPMVWCIYKPILF
ncbi:hypothetical protein D3C71_1396140 [compost metagenome]